MFSFHELVFLLTTLFSQTFAIYLIYRILNSISIFFNTPNEIKDKYSLVLLSEEQSKLLDKDIAIETSKIKNKIRKMGLLLAFLEITFIGFCLVNFLIF